MVSRRRVRKQRLTQLLVGTAVVILPLTASAALAPPHSRLRLVFSAYIAANPDPHGCLGSTGLYADLQANLKKPPDSVAEYQKIASANLPTSVTLIAGHMTYRLTVDRSSSVIGNQQIAWSLRSVRLSSIRAAQLVHTRATVRYKLGGRVVRITAKIDDGRCKSLIG
jgi:hypothetical protein